MRIGFMKNLLAKVIAPIAVMTALSGQPAIAENRSNIHFGVGGLVSANEDVHQRYAGLFGGRFGVDIGFSKYLRSSIDFSFYTKGAEVNGVDYSLTLIQFEPTIQALFEEDGAILYGGIGLTYISAQEKASKGKNEAEAGDSTGGIVAKIGGELLSETSNWGGFVEFSFRKATKGDIEFGGTSLDIGAKYYFDK